MCDLLRRDAEFCADCREEIELVGITVEVNEWALYLMFLGRLTAVARCYELNNEMQIRQENWKNASRGNQNLCVVCLLSGWLSGPRRGAGLQPAEIELAREMAGDQPAPRSALQTVAEALRLAELADDAEGQRCEAFFL